MGEVGDLVDQTDDLLEYRFLNRVLFVPFS